MPRTLAAVLVSLTLTLLGLGCNSNAATVSGDVTFEGQPVEEGQIEFIPSDGKGQTASGPIAKGRYAISGVQLGPKIAQITSYKKGQAVKSVQELADAAKKGTPESDESAALIPADAKGNNTKVEVTAGTQTLHFKLTKNTASAP